MSEITNPLNGEVLPCTRETLAAELQTQRVSASGDDEELKELLDNLVGNAIADGRAHFHDPHHTTSLTIYFRFHVESLFGHIKEELKEALAEVDRLHALSLRLRA